MTTETFNFIVFGDGKEMGFSTTQKGAENVLKFLKDLWTDVADWKIVEGADALGKPC